MDDIATRVKEIIAERLKTDKSKIVESAIFTTDLGADSIEIVDVIMTFEEEFDIEIPEDEESTIQTVQHAIDYIKKKVNA